MVYFLDKHKDCQVVNLDLLTYAGTTDNLKEVDGNPRHIFIKGDIMDRSLVEKIFQQYHILLA
ncbi:MAG: hypothetical protein QM734_14730 [Cyclobacteriaceae bacterium]